MARAKKKVKEVVVVEVKTVGDGDIDPYASGVSIPNPEPNNGNVLGQTTISTVRRLLPSLFLVLQKASRTRSLRAVKKKSQ